MAGLLFSLAMFLLKKKRKGQVLLLVLSHFEKKGVKWMTRETYRKHRELRKPDKRDKRDKTDTKIFLMQHLNAFIIIVSLDYFLQVFFSLIFCLISFLFYPEFFSPIHFFLSFFLFPFLLLVVFASNIFRSRLFLFFLCFSSILQPIILFY